MRYYNLDRGHTSNGGISPVRYEQLNSHCTRYQDNYYTSGRR
ncbi:hypothetical protein [Salmonella enterica]